MLNIQSSVPKVLEYLDPRIYSQRVGRWMELREAENSYILGNLPELIANAERPNIAKTRMFSVEEKGHILAAAVLYPGGCMAGTWASPETVLALVDGILKAGCQITSVYFPAHVSWNFAEMWAAANGAAV